MSADASQSPPPPPPKDSTKDPAPETQKISPEDLAHMLAASMVPPPGRAPGEQPGNKALRKKLLIAVAVGAIGIGASIMSCVGQSFSYRQARAMEGIEQQLKEIRASCSVGTPLPPTQPTQERPR